MQYFQLFQQTPAFQLDEQALEQQYRLLAAQFHPDKFAAASSFEQKQAMMMASTINEAYRTLKSPLDRAAYLLSAAGIEADAPEHTAFPAAFLMQQMEWRENLEDAQHGQDEAALLALSREISAEQQQLLAKLAGAFQQPQLEQAAQYVRQGRFLAKLQQEIQHALP